MSLRRAGVSALLFVVILLGGVVAWKTLRPGQAPGVRAAEHRPPLLLVTSLPLLFAEGFTLSGGGSPALSRVKERYRVEPIALADAASLSGKRLLLMAHPRAQTAEALVELDAWVRAGGRLLLLADPMLEWESIRPLGDPLRPPPGFADTGLLAHWGLQLEQPLVRGPLEAKVDGRAVRFVSPGTLVGSSFRIVGDGRIARGAVGQGRVTLVADADWLANGDGLDLLMSELDRLER